MRTEVALVPSSPPSLVAGLARIQALFDSAPKPGDFDYDMTSDEMWSTAERRTSYILRIVAHHPTDSETGALIVDYSCEDVQEQLQQLKAFSFRLGESMGKTAEDLRATGSSPTAELIADLQNYRQLFQGLQSWLASQPGAPSAGMSNQPPESLEDMQRIFESKVTARRALEFLDHIQQLAHVDGDQHPVLASCQRARQAVWDAVRGPEAISRTTIRAITEGLHPLNALWNLLQHQDGLTDDEWTMALDRVTKHLGRDVATAVARNKLYIRTATVATSNPPVFSN